MTTTTGTGLLVWRRNIEPESRAWSYWVIGGIVALTGFGAFAAYMAEEPGQISTFVGLGAIGSVLFWLVPRVYDWGRRRNPEIRIEGRDLCWAKVRVPIDQVDRWSAVRSTQQFYNGRTWSRSTVGVVSFRMMDGDDSKKFTFAHLSEPELAAVIAAIDPILPGRRLSD